MTLVMHIGAFLASIFAFILLRKSKHSTAYMYLGILILMVTLQFLLIGFTTINNPGTQLYLRLSLGLIPFTYSPLLYFYTISTLQPCNKLKTSNIIAHLVPFFLAFIATVILLISPPKDIILAINENRASLIDIVSECLKMAQILIYLAICLYLVKKDVKRASTISYAVKWLHGFLIYSCILWTHGVLLSAVAFSGIIKLSLPSFAACTYLPSLIWLVWVLYKSLCEHPLLHKTEVLPIKSEPKKYLHSPVNNDLAFEIIQKSNQIMVKEKPFLDPGFSLDTLATTLDIKKQYLSQILNEYQNQNFYQYVNFYRVGEAKRLLKEERKNTIINIAYDSGFNSKSTFNKVFKEHVGQTPGEFKNTAF